ncbi:MAG: acetylornithine deacetylase or succinyl-diaminopimelate desuccinylase [Nocardioidaceae bacterium]|nr:acetylornithine deacetylase or succinyl-diaminopimelate desuccinylase [Nocardioidaceae bacterium]
MTHNGYVLDDLEERALALIDPTALAADLTDLVSFASTGGSIGEADIQAWCASRMTDLALSVDHWPIDVADLARDDAFPGMEVERRSAWGCVGTALSMSPLAPALILNGHVDVVPPGDPDAWAADPWELRTFDGMWWGRGTCDMLGGVAAILSAADAVQRLGITLRRSFALHTVIGEEDGGLGTFATLRRGHRGDVCVIAEPTARSIIAANAGALTFTLEVVGRATHGSTRGSGVSAIDAFITLQAGLAAFERTRNDVPHPTFEGQDLPWPLSVGKIAAGDWASTVPDKLVAEGRYGVMPGETMAQAKVAFERAVADICAADPWLSSHPATVRWTGGMFAPGDIHADHPLVTDVARAVTDVSGEAPRITGAPYGSDLRLYAAAGIPTLQFGPGDVRIAHTADEHVDIADVLEAARTYVLLILRACR